MPIWAKAQLGGSMNDVQENFFLDELSREVRVNGKDVVLTRLEFDLLTELSSHPRQVLTHQYLIQSLWETDHCIDSQALEVYVSRLRKKLGESGAAPHFIETCRGVGYRFRPPMKTHRPQLSFVYDRDGLLLSVLGDDVFLCGWRRDEVVNTYFNPSASSEMQKGFIKVIQRAIEASGAQHLEFPAALRCRAGQRHTTLVGLDFSVANRRIDRVRMTPLTPLDQCR